MKELTLALLTSVAPLSAGAGQETPADTTRPLKLTLDLGYVNAAGNTSVSTLSTGENLVYQVNSFELIQGGSVIYGRSDTTTVAEQMKFGGRAKYLIGRVGGVFVGAGFERDRFAGIARRFDENVGMVLLLLSSSANNWTLELGGALNQQTSTTGIQRNFSALRGATSFRHNFAATTYLQERVEVLPATDDWSDTRINNELSMVAPVSRNVALTMSYQVRFDNEPEPGFGKSDRVFTSGVRVVF